MAYNLKVWAVVCLLIFCAHRFLKASFCPSFLDEQTFNRLTYGWIAITSALFFSFNFWLFLAFSAATLIVLSNRTSLAIAFVGLLFCAPYISKPIQGLGPINYLAALSYPRMLILIFLIMKIIKENSEKELNPRWGVFDTSTLTGSILIFFLAYRDDTLTNSIRAFLYNILDVFAIYWIARGQFNDAKRTQALLGTLTYGIAIISLLAVFESVRKWGLYAHTEVDLGANGMAVFLLRGDTGLLRAYATASHPLSLGYVTMIGVLVCSAVAMSAQVNLRQFWRPLLLITAGLIATVSRGPWVCAAIAYFLWLTLQPRGLTILIRVAVLVATLFTLVLLTPAGDSVIALLPFVGNVETGNIDYRRLLVEVSWIVIQENPWFGSNTFLYEPIMQQLIQGQGIIDLVNHYVATALTTGFVGVGLFLLAHLGPGLLGLRQFILMGGSAPYRLSTPSLATDLELLRGLSCALLASSIALATTSAIAMIPWVCWLLTGATVSVLVRVREASIKINRPAWKARRV